MRFSNLALTAMKSTKLAALLVMNPRPVRSVSCFFRLARQSGGCRAHCAGKQGNPPRGHPGNQPICGRGLGSSGLRRQEWKLLPSCDGSPGQGRPSYAIRLPPDIPAGRGLSDRR